MSETTITPEMVLQVTQVRQDVAERIAVYATLRIGGTLPTDARREVGVAEHTGSTYERLLPVLCARFDLPVPVKSNSAWTFRTQAGSGSHARWHEARGVVSPDCPLCQPEATS